MGRSEGRREGREEGGKGGGGRRGGRRGGGRVVSMGDGKWMVNEGSVIAAEHHHSHQQPIMQVLANELSHPPDNC